MSMNTEKDEGKITSMSLRELNERLKPYPALQSVFLKSMSDQEFEELVTGQVDPVVVDNFVTALGLTKETVTLKALDSALGKLLNNANLEITKDTPQNS